MGKKIRLFIVDWILLPLLYVMVSPLLLLQWLCGRKRNGKKGTDSQD